MKILDVPYHSQRNNELFPYSTCGTTCIAMYLDWLNKKYNKNYVSDDDKVFEALHSPDMLKRASWLEENGYSYIKDYLDSKRIVNGKETDWTHLNNLLVMLAEVGSLLTFYEFDFKYMYLSSNDMKESIDDGFPIVLSGRFPATSGHYILAVGYDDRNYMVCNDPYGNYNQLYKDHNGEKVYYSFKDIWTYGQNLTDSDGLFLCIKAVQKGNIFNTPKPPANPWGA